MTLDGKGRLALRWSVRSIPVAVLLLVWSANSQGAFAQVPEADLSISKSETTDPVAVGGNIDYTITVSNAGPADAVLVTCEDVLPDSVTFVMFQGVTQGGADFDPVTGTVTCAFGGIPAGGSASVFFRVTADEAGTVSNTATTASDTADPDPTNNSFTETTTVTALADLSITKADAADPVTVGDNIQYTITVSNAGPSDALNVTCQDVLPSNVTFVGFSSITQGTAGHVAGIITCNFGTIPSGGSANFVFVVTADEAGTVSNTVTTASSTADPNAANNTDTESTTVVPLSADLSIVKSGNDDTVQPGDNVEYTLTVTNAGPDDAEDVTCEDVLPANVTFLGFQSISQGSATQQAGTITCNFGTIASGATATLVFVVTANEEGVVSNTATTSSSTGDPNSANNSDTETTFVGQIVDVSVTKTDAPDPVNAGGNITYTIVVANEGPVAAEDVELSDSIPSGTTFVSFTAPAGWTTSTPPVGGTGSVTATRAVLASGAEATFTLVVRVNPGSSSDAVITNTANVSTSGLDQNPANDSDSTTTSLRANQLPPTPTQRPNLGVGLQGLFQASPPTPIPAVQAAPATTIRPPSTGDGGLQGTPVHRISSAIAVVSGALVAASILATARRRMQD